MLIAHDTHEHFFSGSGRAESRHQGARHDYERLRASRTDWWVGILLQALAAGADWKRNISSVTRSFLPLVVTDQTGK